MCLFFPFFRKMPKQKVNFGKGIFGIRKWQNERLDDINLLSEISIFFLVVHGLVFVESAKSI